MDFRRLKQKIELEEFELPKIRNMIAQLHGQKLFSVIDLKDGFFHIKIREKDQEKTSFYTGTRQIQFTRMPQGFKNSPGIFQKKWQ